MRTLLAIVILAALGWSGWWFVQSTARDRAVTGWLAERRAAGWVAEAEDVRVRGFPNRVDTVVTELEPRRPGRRLGLAGGRVPGPVALLQAAPRHRRPARRAGGRDPLRDDPRHQRPAARLGDLRPTPRLELDHMTFEIGDMRSTGDGGWTAGDRQGDPRHPAGRRRHALRARPRVQRREPRRCPSGHRRLRADGVLPAEIGPIALDSTLVFDRPWDRPALEDGNPVLERVAIRDLARHLGQARPARPAATLGVDAEGFAEGRIDLRARNWEDDARRGRGGGALDPTLAGAVRAGLGLIARLSRRPRRPRGAARLRRRRRAPRPDPARPGAAAGAALTLVDKACTESG